MESTDFEQLMPAPMCLVETTKDGKLVVKKDTARIISEIKEKTVVVAIAGTYRTGKSFLLNRLMGRNNGFALGPTVESKTKGIWAWCRAHPTNPDWCLLLLDTEGLSDVQKVDSNHDNWIFALSVLLSSTLVYNSFSIIQNDAIDKLHYVTRLSEHIKAKVSNAEGQPDEMQFIKFFPNFVWVVRDFILTLQVNGKPITADEYLKGALKLKSGFSMATNNYNFARQCILQYFREKKCFLLRRPVEKEELFSQLETLRDEDLQEAFLREAHNFCEYIYTSAKPKSVEGRQLSGSMLCHLLEAFVEAIQAGSIPCMESAVKTMSEIANSKAVKKSISHYKAKMAKSVQLPTNSLDELSMKHHSALEESIKMFMSESIFDDNNQFEIELQTLLKEEFKIIRAKNATASENVCKTLLENLNKDIDKKFTNGFYSKPGGTRNFCLDKANALSSYQTTTKKGIMAEQILENFMSSRWKTMEISIVAADTALTEANRKIEAERAEKERETQRALAAERELALREQWKKDQEESSNKCLELLVQKLLGDKERFIEETRDIIKQFTEVQKRYYEQGLKHNAEETQKMISQFADQLQAAGQEHETIKQGGIMTYLKKIGTLIWNWWND